MAVIGLKGCESGKRLRKHRQHVPERLCVALVPWCFHVPQSVLNAYLCVFQTLLSNLRHFSRRPGVDCTRWAMMSCSEFHETLPAEIDVSALSKVY